MTPEHVRGRLWAVVPAAGAGRRFGGDVAKQYIELDGQPLVAHALSKPATASAAKTGRKRNFVIAKPQMLD